MSRKAIRENLFKMLFSADYHNVSDLKEQAELYFVSEETENVSEKDRNELTDKYNDIIEKLETIDSYIGEKSKGWEVSRITKSDLTLLRIAIYEIVYDPDVAESVAVNEAVELATNYGTEKSMSFINGILSSIISDTNIVKCDKNERVVQATKDAKKKKANEELS